MFWLLLSSVYPKSGLLSFPCSVSENAGVVQEFVRGTARTADAKWPKEYSIPKGIILSVSAVGKAGQGQQLRVWLDIGDQLHCICCVF